MVLRIVCESPSTAGRSVSIGVVGLGRHQVIEVEGCADAGHMGQRGTRRYAVAHWIKPISHRAVATGRVGCNALVCEPIDAVIAPGGCSAALLARVGEIASRSTLVAIAAHRRRRHSRQPVLRVVAEGGRKTIRIRRGRHIAGSVVDISRRVVTGSQAIVYHAAKPVLAVVGGALLFRRSNLRVGQKISLANFVSTQWIGIITCRFITQIND